MSTRTCIVVLALAATLGCARGLEGAPAHSRDDTEDAGRSRAPTIGAPGSGAIVVGAGTAISPTYRARVRISARTGAGS